MYAVQSKIRNSGEISSIQSKMKIREYPRIFLETNYVRTQLQYIIFRHQASTRYTFASFSDVFQSFSGDSTLLSLFCTPLPVHSHLNHHSSCLYQPSLNIGTATTTGTSSWYILTSDQRLAEKADTAAVGGRRTRNTGPDTRHAHAHPA